MMMRKTVYTDLLKRLADDIAQIKYRQRWLCSSGRSIYKGNVAKWIKFANSLQMKMGMIIADVDNAAAKSAVEAADAKAFSAAADNADFKYLTASPNTNPVVY